MHKRWSFVTLLIGVMILVLLLVDLSNSADEELASFKTVILLVSILLWMSTVLVTWFDLGLRAHSHRALVAFMLVSLCLLGVLFILGRVVIESSTVYQLVEFSTFVWGAGCIIWISVRRLRLQQTRNEEATPKP